MNITKYPNINYLVLNTRIKEINALTHHFYENFCFENTEQFNTFLQKYNAELHELFQSLPYLDENDFQSRIVALNDSLNRIKPYILA